MPFVYPSNIGWLIMLSNGRRPTAADDRQRRRLHDAPPALSPPSCFYSDSSVRASGSAAPGVQMCCGIFSNNGIQDMRPGGLLLVATLSRPSSEQRRNVRLKHTYNWADSTRPGSPRVRISSWKNIPPLLAVVRPKKACVHGLRCPEAVRV